MYGCNLFFSPKAFVGKKKLDFNFGVKNSIQLMKAMAF